MSALRHRYFVARCACGHETVARPGTVLRQALRRGSVIEGRRRNLQLKERGLVGPALATFIWEAVIAFVHDPRLPPTNNDAALRLTRRSALRHAVIARRISFGTRTAEGSRCYAAALSVIETCRKRAVDVWAYPCDLPAAARNGLTFPLPSIAQPT